MEHTAWCTDSSTFTLVPSLHLLSFEGPPIRNLSSYTKNAVTVIAGEWINPTQTTQRAHKTSTQATHVQMNTHTTPHTHTTHTHTTHTHTQHTHTHNTHTHTTHTHTTHTQHTHNTYTHTKHKNTKTQVAPFAMMSQRTYQEHTEVVSSD